MSDIILKNGKTFKEALKEVQKYKKPESQKFDTYDYFSYDEYTSAMNSAFGSDGYKPSYDDFKIIELSNGQLVASLRCTIEILDEHGQVCFTATGIGTKENERSREQNKYIFLNNLGYFTQQQAYKSACKSLFVFLEKRNNPDDNCGSSNSNGNTAANRAPENNRFGSNSNNDWLDIRVAVCGGLLELGNDRDTGRPKYKLICNPVVDGVEKKENPIEVFFYPNQYMKKYENYNGLEKFTSFIKKYESSAPAPENKEYKRFDASILCVKGRTENSYTFKKFK